MFAHNSRFRQLQNHPPPNGAALVGLFILATGPDGRHAMLPVHGYSRVGGPQSGE